MNTWVYLTNFVYSSTQKKKFFYSSIKAKSEILEWVDTNIGNKTNLLFEIMLTDTKNKQIIHIIL